MHDERSPAFQQLRTFLTKQMRMSHLYQPLMLRTIGKAVSHHCATLQPPSWRTTRARSSTTSRSPSGCLGQYSRHQLVRRDGAEYGLYP
jgi:hypothetical protein